jgi:predicted TIM-barrel fold metal-dependent hydrolase
VTPQFADTHVHFFDLRRDDLRYAWLEGSGDDAETAVLGDYSAIRAHRYWADDFIAETRFHNVVHAIHVQAAIGTPDPVAETRWLQAFADRLGTPDAAIAYADLASPNIDATLEEHASYPIFRGIRDLRDDEFIDSHDWQRGFARLAKHEAVCTLSPPIAAAPAVAALARQCPDVTLCIDHAMTPLGRNQEYLTVWRQALRCLAEPPNVVVKVSGLGMGDHTWSVESFRPIVLSCIEEFGISRTVFGTNWPVDRLYSSYGDVVAAYAQIIAPFEQREQEALLLTNACRIFRLSCSHRATDSQEHE